MDAHSYLLLSRHSGDPDITIHQVTALIRYIQPIYMTRMDCKIHIDHKTEAIALNLDHAVPFGLIVTELLTNAMKYGIVEGHSLEIRITSVLTPQDTIQITIWDNGPGIDPTLDLETTDSLGLKLVRMLIEAQLEGQLHLADTHGQGACWVVEWPLPENKKQGLEG